MQRIITALAIAVVMVATLVASTIPAMATSSAGSLIFIPVPNGVGGTYRCASGPPFVSKLDSPEANCIHQQSGAPAGLVCDIPTTIMFVPAAPKVPSVPEYEVGGLLCR